MLNVGFDVGEGPPNADLEDSHMPGGPQIAANGFDLTVDINGIRDGNAEYDEDDVLKPDAVTATRAVDDVTVDETRDREVDVMADRSGEKGEPTSTMSEGFGQRLPFCHKNLGTGSSFLWAK